MSHVITCLHIAQLFFFFFRIFTYTHTNIVENIVSLNQKGCLNSCVAHVIKQEVQRYSEVYSEPEGISSVSQGWFRGTVLRRLTCGKDTKADSYLQPAPVYRGGIACVSWADFLCLLTVISFRREMLSLYLKMYMSQTISLVFSSISLTWVFMLRTSWVYIMHLKDQQDVAWLEKCTGMTAKRCESLDTVWIARLTLRCYR